MTIIRSNQKSGIRRAAGKESGLLNISKRAKVYYFLVQSWSQQVAEISQQ